MKTQDKEWGKLETVEEKMDISNCKEMLTVFVCLLVDAYNLRTHPCKITTDCLWNENQKTQIKEINVT